MNATDVLLVVVLFVGVGLAAHWLSTWGKQLFREADMSLFRLLDYRSGKIPPKRGYANQFCRPSDHEDGTNERPRRSGAAPAKIKKKRWIAVWKKNPANRRGYVKHDAMCARSGDRAK